MSNLWPNEFAGSAASVNICGARGVPVFTPWSNGDDEIAFTAEDRVVPDGAEHFAPAEADAFTQGFEEGRRTVELEYADERAALARLAESLDNLRPEPTNILAAMLSETVERLVRQIVGEVEIDAKLLAHRAERAAALVGHETAPAKLRVNPADVALLDEARLPIPVVGDDALSRGTIVIECGEGWIEDGPEIRLQRLRAELDQMGAPE